VTGAPIRRGRRPHAVTGGHGEPLWSVGPARYAARRAAGGPKAEPAADAGPAAPPWSN